MNSNPFNKINKFNIKSKKSYLAIISLIFIYSLFTIGITYAYFAYQVEDTVAITGNVIAINAEVKVELVSGTNEHMVPLKTTALQSAIKGTGSTNGACIDSTGNLSCQVYKISLINKGSRLQHLNGTIELYAKDGNGNVYTNLKWRELTNEETIKEDAIINGMSKSPLVTDLTIESKTTQTWYIAVWINEENSNQLNTDKGDFGGTVTFEAGGAGSVTTPFIRDVMKTQAISDKDIDFSQTSEVSKTNGIYYIEETKNDTNPIYYYRGQVDNNLIFAGFCWKIVRTTETGGLKLIYNGLPSNRQCNNTGTATSIGNKAFNTTHRSQAYVGYMYGPPYEASYKLISSSDTYVYGNGINYSNGTYTLTNTITGTWSSLYNGGLNNNHYTCFTTGTTCSSVSYINYTTSSEAHYITLTSGKTVENALSEMLDNNSTSSTIKGNNTTEGTLDYWYYTNIYNQGYSSYIEDTVWCNDRGVGRINGWNPNGGSTNSFFYYSPYVRVFSKASPSVSCSRDIDKFTVSDSKGNGALDYPVGLLTADEIMLAGGDKSNSNNVSYYLYSGSDYWAGSPIGYSNAAIDAYVGSGGNLYISVVKYDYGVRPSVSLKPGFTLTGDGDGTVTNPYQIS